MILTIIYFELFANTTKNAITFSFHMPCQSYSIYNYNLKQTSKHTPTF
jgi:hypothetical protein